MPMTPVRPRKIHWIIKVLLVPVILIFIIVGIAATGMAYRTVFDSVAGRGYIEDVRESSPIRTRGEIPYQDLVVVITEPAAYKGKYLALGHEHLYSEADEGKWVSVVIHKTSPKNELSPDEVNGSISSYNTRFFSSTMGLFYAYVVIAAFGFVGLIRRLKKRRK